MESRKFGETTLKEDYADLIGLDLEEEEELIIIENQDLNQLRFGGEYLFTEIWDFAVIPLRIGAQTYPTLFMDNNDEQVVGGGLSLGTGLITDRYSLDISFKNTEFEIVAGDILEKLGYAITSDYKNMPEIKQDDIEAYSLQNSQMKKEAILMADQRDIESRYPQKELLDKFNQLNKNLPMVH